jgi:Phage integrase family
MREALKIQGTGIVLHDTTGQQLLSTNRPFGERLPRDTNTEMLNRVVATGKPQISDLIIGAVLRRPILSVGVPVLRDGRVAYLGDGAGPRSIDRVVERANPAPRLERRNIRPPLPDRRPQPGARPHIGQPAMPELRARISRNRTAWRAKSIAVAPGAFLRFLVATGRCPAGREYAVPGFASWRLTSVPGFLTAEEIERVIAACASEHRLRDKAVVLLLARLGLRASEVANLDLYQIDWRGRTPRCRR